jgi:hypothetical protein
MPGLSHAENGQDCGVLQLLSRALGPLRRPPLDLASGSSPDDRMPHK